MGSARPHSPLPVSENLPVSEKSASAAWSEPAELAVLREENKQLKELVTRLSEIVIRNVVERPSRRYFPVRK
jgi:hypothetical protein